MRQLLPRLTFECAGLHLTACGTGCTTWTTAGNAAAFAACQQSLHALHAAKAQVEMTVVYVDECHFPHQAPVPCAWQVRGQPPIALCAVTRATRCWTSGKREWLDSP